MGYNSPVQLLFTRQSAKTPLNSPAKTRNQKQENILSDSLAPSTKGFYVTRSWTAKMNNGCVLTEGSCIEGTHWPHARSVAPFKRSLGTIAYNRGMQVLQKPASLYTSLDLHLFVLYESIPLF